MDCSNRSPCGEQETISLKVSHGPNHHEVSVPSNSTFGDVKSAIAQKIGLESLDSHILLFRGKEKEDDDDLQTSGVKDSAKLLLVERANSKRKSPEKVVEEPIVVSRGGPAVAEVREEVDKLSQQVEALKAVIDSNTKVDEKDIVYLTEMLMRELLKLDTIEAEGEGRVQRKSEVRRIQDYVETMDNLKSKNSNIPTDEVDSSNTNPNPVPETIQWETFDDEVEIANSENSASMQPPLSDSNTQPSPVLHSPSTPSIPTNHHQSSAETSDVSQKSLAQNSPKSSSPSTKVTQQWEHFD